MPLLSTCLVKASRIFEDFHFIPLWNVNVIHVQSRTRWSLYILGKRRKDSSLERKTAKTRGRGDKKYRRAFNEIRIVKLEKLFYGECTWFVDRILSSRIWERRWKEKILDFLGLWMSEMLLIRENLYKQFEYCLICWRYSVR